MILLVFALQKNSHQAMPFSRHAYSFSRESPSRFRKEMLKVADEDGKGAIGVDSLNTILVNIGRAEERLSEDELNVILKEAGASQNDRAIPLDKLLQLL